MKLPQENEKDIELFIESYSTNLSDAEKKEILKHYDLYTETYGKDIFDVHHNIDISVKKKYKLRFCISKNAGAILLIPFALFFIIGYILHEYLPHFELKLGLVLIIFLIILYKILKKITGDATKKVHDYHYYIYHVAKRELKNKTKRGDNEVY